MKIEVNLKKKYFFTLLAVLIVLSGALVVYAYNSSPANPATFGHSANELEVTLPNGNNVTLDYAVRNGLLGNSSSGAGTVSLGSCKNACFSSGSGCDANFSSNADPKIFDCNSLFPGYPVVTSIEEIASGAEWFVSKVKCCAIRGGATTVPTAALAAYKCDNPPESGWIAGSCTGAVTWSDIMVTCGHQIYLGGYWRADQHNCSIIGYALTP